jgi:hypothetical protein
MKKSSHSCVVTVFLMLGVFGVSLPATKAQPMTDGAILGTVTDPSGASVSNATATAQNLGTNAQNSATTDGNGRYLITHLPPGVYSLQIP